MPIPPGTKIGPYTVEAEIGRGGMGVVYRASDERLDRNVALKALPAELAGNPDRLARFEREARLLAQLNHPNLAGLFGLEEQDGATYLVLELVEGETLAERLDRGPLPVVEALELAIEIARGVEAAHEAGVVHRDLKPGNVKITPDGKAKVLDFGLARADDLQSSDSGDLTQTPTQTTPLQHSPTIPGAILGTAPYMSPEQARGRAVDKRSDVWSFAVVLYEMLVGSGPFAGDSAADCIGAILHKKVDLSRLPPDTPPLVLHVMRRCLERDKAKRYRDIGDVRIELAAALEDPSAGVLPTDQEVAPVRGGLPRWTALVGVPLLIAAGVGLAWMFRPQAPEVPTTHLGLLLPDDVRTIVGADLTPDGRHFAFVGLQRPEEGGESRRGTTAIYIRDLGAAEARKLPGTEQSSPVRFSPSGERIFFTRRDSLRPTGTVESMPAEGGPTLTVFEYNTQRSQLDGFVWAPVAEDELLVMGRGQRELYRITTSGAAPELVSKLQPAGSDGDPHPDSDTFRSIRLPRPDGRFAVLTGYPAGGSTASLWRVDLETGETSLVLENARSASFTDDGRIWFIRNEALFVAPFDLDRAEVTGAAEWRMSGFRGWRIDRSGDRFVYVVASSLRDQESIVLIDPAGEIETLVEGADFEDPRISPDGRRLVYEVEGDVASRIWIRDFDSGLARAITPEEENCWAPRWTHDGRLAYNRGPGNNHELLVRDPTPVATPEPLIPQTGPGLGIDEPSFTPDGRYIIVDSVPRGGQEGGLYLYDADDADSARPFFATEGLEGSGVIRPDGQWVAYQANASGRVEVYLRRLVPEDPESAPIHPVTTTGGMSPRWSADGKILYYEALADRSIFAVSVTTEPRFELSEPRLLVEEGARDESDAWDVTPDGRLVAIRESDALDGAQIKIRVISNWD
jgi:Tol biopolymer transport system component